jgi:hypothetical protein
LLAKEVQLTVEIEGKIIQNPAYRTQTQDLAKYPGEAKPHGGETPDVWDGTTSSARPISNQPAWNLPKLKLSFPWFKKSAISLATPSRTLPP